ncbi:MAG TPA: TraR/DksA C4-type zinc finger protein [Urbifossiella sp.]|jgi:RNA polymerase-binding transcription factor DksA|nr:TraR/DksA C4-type zinc finger protein [Urbifossiella sp.]
MTATKTRHFRDQLRLLADRVGGTAARLEDLVRTPTSGESAGGLSNVPLHLGDVGTETFTQELNATLLENEAHIRDEVLAALDRIEAGTFGRCEGCGKTIPGERLEALPYARHCVGCAEKFQSGVHVNLNTGRPGAWQSGLDGTDADGAQDDDVHAAGTPGGGGPAGGLAGTNAGRGDPADVANLEQTMGSGNYDQEQEGADEDDGAHSGPAGGAVGGTPANKRAGTRKRSH